jgi:hypothetical protein
MKFGSLSFFFFLSKKKKVEAKLTRVISECLSASFLSEWDSMMAEMASTTFANVASPEEHSLGYTEAHNKYSEFFEKKLESALKKEGISPEKFASICEVKIERFVAKTKTPLTIINLSM